ncbi:hypothetical protein C0995_002928 [Termitomyces sp. Mi166|nr:hypothetical protein C0995_002928 [Termitomyces sp. Mi166\
MSPRPSSSPSPPTPPPTPPITPSERSFLTRGKHKEVDLGYDGLRDPEPVISPETPTYPPTNNDSAETRRIEENLRRWDVAERQRRKSARESAQPTPSLVSDLSRTASLLWSSKRPKHKHDSILGNHVALQSQENINSVSIDDLNATPTPSPSPSPTPSRDSDPQNPFENPSESLSPFADPLQSLPITEKNPSTDSASSPGLQINRSPAKRVPPGPPMPLGLPPPRTPPPIHTAPSPTSPLSTLRPADTTREDPQETMWWHEWLCGCSEGPERGGDYQKVILVTEMEFSREQFQGPLTMTSSYDLSATPQSRSLNRDKSWLWLTSTTKNTKPDDPPISH